MYYIAIVVINLERLKHRNLGLTTNLGVLMSHTNPIIAEELIEQFYLIHLLSI